MACQSDQPTFARLEATLSEKLRGLLHDADEKWPFVPEKWQCRQNGTAVDVNDFLEAPNDTMGMKEKDVLLVSCDLHYIVSFQLAVLWNVLMWYSDKIIYIIHGRGRGYHSCVRPVYKDLNRSL